MNKIKYILAIVAIIIIWFLCKTYINIEVSKRTNKLVDDYEQKINEIKVKLASEKIDLEKNLKQQIVSSKLELDKCMLEKETESKKKQYIELSKKNPKEFKRQVDKTLGVKEKRK